MGLMDIFRVGAIKREKAQLQIEPTTERQNADHLHQLISDIGAQDALAVKLKTIEFQAQADVLQKQCVEIMDSIRTLKEELEQKRRDILVVDDTLLFESFSLYQPKFKLSDSTEYAKRLEQIRNRQKEMIKSGSAVTANENWTVNNSKVEGRKMVADMKKLLLRSFNNECDYCVDNVKFNNIESHASRIEKSFEAVRKLGRILDASITSAYKQLKLDELYLAFEYQQKKQEEKEEQKRMREEAREQQKLEQEIRQAREKIAKERKHFSAAIKELEAKLANAGPDSQADLNQKLDEMRGQFSALDAEEKVIDYREQNAKAGYVYIISNIGAFGENVFKIGMTRRLEPKDRIDELGDASVPFSFDIHALIFSDNAPALEAKLHARFERKRINKINGRKEFFRVDLEEIEAVIRENYDKVFDIIHAAPAEQFRESLLLAA